MLTAALSGYPASVLAAHMTSQHTTNLSCTTELLLESSLGVVVIYSSCVHLCVGAPFGQRHRADGREVFLSVA